MYTAIKGDISEHTHIALLKLPTTFVLTSQSLMRPIINIINNVENEPVYPLLSLCLCHESAQVKSSMNSHVPSHSP